LAVEANMKISIRSGSAVILVSLLLLPAGARAQDSPEGALTVGSKVRFDAPSAIRGTVQGTVMQMDDTYLLVSTESHTPFKVARQAITRLEVTVGRQRRARKGLIVGAIVGAAMVAVIAASSVESFCSPGQTLEQCRTDRSTVLAVGIPVTALEGALVGHFVKTDRWSSVPVEKVRFSLAPKVQRDGVGVALSLRF
jgi:hypothetical protein